MLLASRPEIINGRLYVGADALKAISGKGIRLIAGQWQLTEPAAAAAASEAYTPASLYQLALKTDKTVKKAELDLERIGYVLDRVETNFSVKPVTYGTSAEDAAALGALNALESTRSSEKLLVNAYAIAKDTLSYKIIAACEDIITGQGSLAYLEQVIKVTEKEVRFAELKTQLGTLSPYDLTKLKTSLAGYRSKLEMQRLAVENAYEKLNNLAGLPKEKRYTVTLPTAPVAPKAINLDSKVAEVLGVSPSIGSLETTVALAQNNVSFYTYNAGGDPLSAKMVDVEKAKLDLASARQALRRAVEELSINRDSLYQQYQSVLSDQTQAERDATVAALNYQVGLISELDYQKATLKQAELRQTELSTRVAVDKLDRTLDRPWISTQ